MYTDIYTRDPNQTETELASSSRKTEKLDKTESSCFFNLIVVQFTLKNWVKNEIPLF